MFRVKVARIKLEAERIKSFDLVPIDGEHLPKFSAGAHIDVALDNNIIRQYSLYNSPDELDHYRIAVLHDQNSRGGSNAMHVNLNEGDELIISPPRNHFKLKNGVKKSWLFAGGIGITPILSMAETLYLQGDEFELHYCARSLDRMAFVHYLKDAPYADRVHMYLDEDDNSPKFKPEYILASPRPDNHLYVCGPEGFMGYVIGTAESLYWRANQIHREYFKASTAKSLIRQPFRIEVASTGVVYDIPADQSVVDVLSSQAGIKIPVSCEQGVCGSCLTRVISGELEHHDVFMSSEEQALGKVFTPCCSRGHGLVRLDL